MAELKVSPEGAKAYMCKRSFEYFVKVFWDEVPGTQELKWNWHMTYLCQLLQKTGEDLFAGRPRKNDVIVNISPGTTKSTLCSILYPAWLWIRMAHCRIITASHTDDLVLDLSNKSRSVIKSDLYLFLFPEIEMSSDQDAKGYFRNTKGGDRYTCTVSGKSPMGMHAHVIIIDDPIDPKKAASEVELKVAQDFFDNVIPSRKIDREATITFLIMQRLHPEDPTGHLLKKSRREGAAPIQHIKLPAELLVLEDGSYDTSAVIPEELATFYVDGLMDPVRLTRRSLKERMTDGQFAYAGQYLQDPIALGGGMFKPEFFSLRCKASPYNCRRVRYWDRASTEGAGARTAGVLLAMSKEKRLYVEHVVAGQWEPSKRNAIMKAVALRDRARYGPHHEPVIWIEREGGSSGKDAFQAIVRLLSGFHVREHNIMGMGKKEVRADPWSAQLAAGNVWLVDNGESEGHGKSDWDIQAYIDEHLSFPVGTFLDQVDASSGGLAVVSQMPDRIGVRVLTTSAKKEKSPQLIVCTKEDASSALTEGPVLMIHVSDPSPVGQEDLELSIGDIVDKMSLQFCDLQPEEVQDHWLEPIEPYGKLAEELVFQRQQAKKLWSFLLRRRDRPVSTIVIVSDNSRKAISIAMAVSDTMNLERKSINVPTDGNTVTEGKAPNKYVYDVARLGRHMVVE